MEKNDYEIVEEKEFQRGSIREHIAKENVINPQIIKDGKYKIAVWTSDTCGNQTTPIYKEFKVDTNAPSGLAIVFHKSIESGFIKEILSDMGIWAIFQDFARYECEATDEEMEFPGSGVEKLEYSTDQQNWIQVENNSFQLLSNYMGKIYLRATDKAGNVSTPSDKIIGKDIDTDSISPTSLIVDGEKPGKPVIIATSGKGSYTEDTWTNQAVQINVTSKVPLSGIDYYEYTTKKNAKESDWKKLNQTTNTQIHMDQKVGMIQDRITISKDENATYYFRAVSNSKKYSDVAGIHVKIQLTKPSIAVVRLTPATPDGDNGWYAKKKPKIMM